MKELIALYRESPVAFVLICVVLLGVGSGSGMISGIALGDDVKEESKRYTDEKIETLAREMKEGFKKSDCTLMKMQRDAANAQLFNVSESDRLESTEDKRREINRLKRVIDDLNLDMQKCR